MAEWDHRNGRRLPGTTRGADRSLLRLAYCSLRRWSAA
jgi:hypothetical protein